MSSKITKERLDEMKLSETDRDAYNAYLNRLRNIASEEYNKMVDAKDLIDKSKEAGKEEQLIESIIGLYEIGLSNDKIAKGLKITLSKVEEVIKNLLNKE